MTSNTPHRMPPKVPRPEPAPLASSPAIAQLEASLGAAADPQRKVREFWVSHPRTPLIEQAEAPSERGEQIVTFLWRDAEAHQVLLFVNRLTDERYLEASLMRRVTGTDLWHLSYRMTRDWRASYSFVTRAAGEEWSWGSIEEKQLHIRRALDSGLADPRNPRTVRNRLGTVMSVVELPSAPPQLWLEPRTPAAPEGAVEAMVLPDAPPVRVYRSPGATESVPVLIVFDGEVWVGPRGGVRGQDMPTTLDNLVADGEIPPLIALFVDSGGRDQRWQQLDAQGGQGAWVADRLLPWARRHLPISDRSEDVIAVGQSLGGYTSLRLALERPDTVGCAIAQSPSLWQRALAPASDGSTSSSRIYLEVGSQEWVLRDPCRRFASEMQSHGIHIRFREYNGGHDYACWRGGVADGLRTLLGPTTRADRLGESPE